MPNLESQNMEIQSLVRTSEIANGYGEVDRQFLTGVAVVISILFITWMFMLGKGELICISIISTFWIPARRGGSRSFIVIISAGFAFSSYLLYIIEINTKIFATANDIFRLSKPLQSRFRRLFLPKYTEQQFIEVAVKVLPKINENLARYIGTIVFNNNGDIRDRSFDM